MQREVTIQELENIDSIDEPLIVKRQNKQDLIVISLEEYKKIFQSDLLEKLKKAEEQIKNGEVVDADAAFKEMREKYGY